MRIATNWCLSPNIGDALAPWLVERLSKDKAVWMAPGTDVQHYLVTGSILNNSSRFSVAWGAGLASWKDEVFPGADIRAVRGPLSLLRAMSCGWRPGKYGVQIGDPGLLVSRLIPATLVKNKVGIVPHYVDMHRVSFFEKQLNDCGAVVIDPFLPPEEFCAKVSSCTRVATSALHGAIIADSYGIPNRIIKLSDSIGGDGMKYWDYLASVGRCSPTNPPEIKDLRLTTLGGLVDALNDIPAFQAAEQAKVRAMQDVLLKSCPFRTVDL